MTPELDALRKTLRQVFALHLNGGRNGHTYGYKIVDEQGNRVGSKSVHNAKKPPKTTVVYTLGDKEFDSVEPFLLAYQQQLRDREWEAAGPKEATA